MLSFTCSFCRKHLKAPEAMAGRRIRCPKCQEIIRIPGNPVAFGHPHPQTHAEDIHPGVAPAPHSGGDLRGDEQIRFTSIELDAKSGDRSIHVSILAESVTAPHPEADPPPAQDSRNHYFAPAGYAETEPKAVPFVAPELRRRLNLALTAGHDATAHSANSAGRP